VTVRARLTASAVVAGLALGAVVIGLVRSATPGCGVVAPRPSLPAALRALGDFDQAYNPADTATLDDAAVRAASALHADLIGTRPQPAVMVGALQAGSPDAIVVPLRAQPSSSQANPPLAGLVVFLRDCQGNAYFATVEDDAGVQPQLQQFPPVDGAEAAARLGTAGTRLVYSADPLHPEWLTVSSPAASLAAR
jgi:hypothetical protein